MRKVYLLFLPLFITLTIYVYLSFIAQRVNQEEVDMKKQREREVNFLKGPVQHPVFGGDKKQLDPTKKYMLINEHGRGFNNYLFGLVRGVMVARELGRIPLIRKVFVNEHLFPIEEYFTAIPSPAYTKSVPRGFFRNSTIIPKKLHNVYPYLNGIESLEEYKERFQNISFQTVYDVVGEPVEFIEDYISDLSTKRGIMSVFVGTRIEWPHLGRLLKRYQHQLLVFHNTFYLALEANVRSVLHYKRSFLEKCKQIMHQQLNIIPHDYIVVHMRLGDFKVRDYTKDSTFSISALVKNIETIQEQLGGMPVVIITNEPEDEDLVNQLKAHETGLLPWITTSNVKFEEKNPHFRVLFDLVVGHFSTVFLYNPSSTFSSNVLLTRASDRLLLKQKFASFTHKDLVLKPPNKILEELELQFSKTGPK